MNKKCDLSIIVLSFILLLTLVSYSTDQPILDFPEQIAARFKSYLTTTYEEKVYIQTDKPYYSAGENIWFNGFLINAETLQPLSLSRYIYVEFINQKDSVVSRVKVRKDSVSFAGYIKLKPTLPSGNYNLRAYTYWMQNNSPDFFFNKNITIGNRIDDRVTCKATYGTLSNGELPVTLNFTNEAFKPIAGDNITIVDQLQGSNKKKKSVIRTNPEGNISFNIPYDSSNRTQRILDVSINQETLKYKTQIYLPFVGDDFDVQFFPESGVFLDNKQQIMAFKAIGADGLSVNVSGILFSDKNEKLAEFQSLDKGMGKFMLETSPSEKYYALIKSDKGIEKRFDLPQTQSNGVALHLAFNRGRIIYELKRQKKNNQETLYMLIHSNGRVLLMQPIKKDIGQIQEDVFNSGIFAFSVIDSLGNTLCERLFFEKPQSQPSITMKTNKASYDQRDQVELSFSIQTAPGRNPSGHYSLSVTDSRFVKQDTLTDNILSYLLLSSDIKGHVEDPATYFTDNQVPSREKLDILMLTQGWRRYNTFDVVKGKLKSPMFFMEAGQSLSGKVLNLFGKPSLKSDVYAISSKIFKRSKTDSLGSYLIDGIEFEDSTIFNLKAKKSKGFADVSLVPDKDVFPNPKSFFIQPRAEQKASAPAEYFDQSKRNYYNEGGMRMIYLDEVTVKAAKKTSEAQKYFFTGFADREMNATQLENTANPNLLEAIQSFPGVSVVGVNDIRIRGSKPTFYIDGFKCMEEDNPLDYLETNDLEKIELFNGSSVAMFGSSAGDVVIALYLKKGTLNRSLIPASVAKIKPLGFQKPDHFYVPKYEVQSAKEDPKPDLRTTIYWNPSLKSDSTGMVNVKFYTADQPNDYSVVLEGITIEGEICRFTGVINRK